MWYVPCSNLGKFRAIIMAEITPPMLDLLVNENVNKWQAEASQYLHYKTYTSSSYIGLCTELAPIFHLLIPSNMGHTLEFLPAYCTAQFEDIPTWFQIPKLCRTVRYLPWYIMIIPLDIELYIMQVQMYMYVCDGVSIIIHLLCKTLDKEINTKGDKIINSGW